MQHDFDFTYRGHEIVIMHDDTGYACDIREDDYDGELLDGFIELKTKREAVIKAIDYVEQYIHDQTHFTEGISL